MADVKVPADAAELAASGAMPAMTYVWCPARTCAAWTVTGVLFDHAFVRADVGVESVDRRAVALDLGPAGLRHLGRRHLLQRPVGRRPVAAASPRWLSSPCRASTCSSLLEHVPAGRKRTANRRIGMQELVAAHDALLAAVAEDQAVEEPLEVRLCWCRGRRRCARRNGLLHARDAICGRRVRERPVRHAAAANRQPHPAGRAWREGPACLAGSQPDAGRVAHAEPVGLELLIATYFRKSTPSPRRPPAASGGLRHENAGNSEPPPAQLLGIHPAEWRASTWPTSWPMTAASSASFAETAGCRA